jgi:hypothetical protein
VEGSVTAKKNYCRILIKLLSVPVAVRSKGWVWGCSHTEIAGSNPAGTWCYSVVSVVGCPVEVCCECCVLLGRGLL